jgi:L-ascorbate metabolism protein UlaG (beta-lactamase superfamily)
LIEVTYVGHATVLTELDGARLLTDPVLRDRVLHLRRAPTAVVPPLGELDAVLVSHAHWDHLDLGSLERLGRDVRIVIPRGAGKLVRRRGFADVVELDLGDRVEIGSVAVTATRADHDAGRGPFGARAPAFGYLIEGTRRVYFAGDTDLFPELAELAPVDLALLPVAGWGPRVPAGHLDPRRAAEAARLLAARAAVPIHWGTYTGRSWNGGRGSAERTPADQFARDVAELVPGSDVRILPPGGSATFE